MNIKFRDRSIKVFHDALMVVLDAMILIVALLLSLLLRYEWNVPQKDWSNVFHSLVWLLPCYAVINIVGGTYRILWRYAKGEEYVRLGVLYGLSCLATLILNQFVFPHPVPVSVLIMAAVLGYGCTVLVRYLWYFVQYAFQRRVKKDGIAPRRTLIVGAGEGALWALDNCLFQNYGIPVAIVDDSVPKQGKMIHHVPVKGMIEDIPQIVKTDKIEDIVIAIPSLPSARLAEIAEICLKTNCRVRTISFPREIGADGKPKKPVMRALDPQEILSRKEIKLDDESIADYITDKTVLVTGGGGSIGSEICRQVLRFSPKLLVIFEIYENSAYELQYELRRSFGEDVPVKIVIGSVRDRARLDDVMARYKPNVVFHAAAHKHVPLMEDSPLEAIKNNVFGTRNTMESAAQHDVDRFVILSTDKAVNPTSVMGATKRVTELIIQSIGPKYKMKCMAVRFGNVVNSHGSLVPIIQAQIESGGPVTITHPDIARYFMTIPEAAQLVLQAGALAQDGAIYVLDMGEPVRIMDLAEKLIRIYGYTPNKDIEIKIIGLRPGEKMNEELMMKEEKANMQHTAHNLIFVASPIRVNQKQLVQNLAQMENLCMNNNIKALDVLKRIVPIKKPDEQTGQSRKKA